jgi:TolA-binding protein
MSVMKATLFKDLLQVTQNPAFLLPMLEHLPTGKYKRKLRETLDVMPQMQQQLQQASEQINILQGEIDRQIQQNIELQKRLEVEKASSKITAETIRVQSDLREQLASVATDLRLVAERQKLKSDSSEGAKK